MSKVMFSTYGICFRWMLVLIYMNGVLLVAFRTVFTRNSRISLKFFYGLTIGRRIAVPRHIQEINQIQKSELPT